MALAKRSFYILLLLSFGIGNTKSYAQLWRYLTLQGNDENSQKQDGVYTITSIDGKLTKVRIVRKALTDGITRIKTATDRLGIMGTMGIDTVFALNKNLLQVVYSPHGGSNDGYQNTLILAVNKGKLYIVMEVMSYHEFGLNGPDGIYKLNVRLTGQNLKDNQLLVNVRDIDSSGTDAAKQHDLRRSFVLKYDSEKNIFYNGVRNINVKADFYDNKTDQLKQRYIKGAFPVIKIDDYEYFFIGKIWYGGGKNTYTGKYSFSAYCVPLK